MKLRTLKLSLRLAFLAAMLVSIVSLSSPATASASYCSHLCENHCSNQFWDCVAGYYPGVDCCVQANECLDSCGDCPRWCF
jgi:hypothetical protein